MNIVSWLSRSPHVVFLLFILLDSAIVGYSITVMDWQRKTDKRRVLVQSRMKSRIWSLDPSAGHFSRTVSPLPLVWPLLGEVIVSQTLADDCLENKAGIKPSFVPKPVVSVGNNGD